LRRRRQIYRLHEAGKNNRVIERKKHIYYSYTSNKQNMKISNNAIISFDSSFWKTASKEICIEEQNFDGKIIVLYNLRGKK